MEGAGERAREQPRLNLSDRSSTVASCTRASTPASSPSPSLSALDQGQRFRKRPNPDIVAERSVGFDVKGQDVFVKEQEISPQSTSTRPNTQRLMEAGRLRLSHKKDLAPSKISVVGFGAIYKNFLQNDNFYR